MKQEIEIRGLRLTAYIGVPEEERSAPQELRVNIRVSPAISFGEMEDEIDRTIDYARLAEELKVLTLARPRSLLETLAEDIAAHILGLPLAQHVEISIEKRILPDTDYVAVHLAKSRRGES